jgi:hypothetical protein
MKHARPAAPSDIGRVAQADLEEMLGLSGRAIKRNTELLTFLQADKNYRFRSYDPDRVSLLMETLSGYVSPKRMRKLTGLSPKYLWHSPRIRKQLGEKVLYGIRWYSVRKIDAFIELHKNLDN